MAVNLQEQQLRRWLRDTNKWEESTRTFWKLIPQKENRPGDSCGPIHMWLMRDLLALYFKGQGPV
jgi:hypothetical protein